MSKSEWEPRPPKGLHKGVDRNGNPYDYFGASDGSRIVVHTSGKELKDGGVPVFYLHGSPGWGGGPNPRARKLFLQRTYLISPTRPGYYESTRKEGRSVQDVVRQIGDIATAMGIDQFYVVGRSGGGRIIRNITGLTI